MNSSRCSSIDWGPATCLGRALCPLATWDPLWLPLRSQTKESGWNNKASSLTQLPGIPFDGRLVLGLAASKTHSLGYSTSYFLSRSLMAAILCKTKCFYHLAVGPALCVILYNGLGLASAVMAIGWSKPGLSPLGLLFFSSIGSGHTCTHFSSHVIFGHGTSTVAQGLLWLDRQGYSSGLVGDRIGQLVGI